MDDAEFQAALVAAFQTPSDGVVRRDLIESVLQRTHRDSRARVGVLAGAGLVGVGIAATAVVATRLARPLAEWVFEALRDFPAQAAAADATPFVCVGLALMLLAAARNRIRDF